MTNSISIIIKTVSIPFTNLPESGPITNTPQSCSSPYLSPSEPEYISISASPTSYAEDVVESVAIL